MIRVGLPDADELHWLAGPRPEAVSLYVPLDAAHPRRAVSAGTVLLRKALGGAPRGLRVAIRKQWDDAARRWDLRSGQGLAAFLTPSSLTGYVLPERVEAEARRGSSFELGQLMRAVAAPQAGYLVTVCASGWELWEGTPVSGAARVRGDGFTLYRAGGVWSWVRSQVLRSAAPPGRSLVAEVTRVVGAELARRDPRGLRPVLLAGDPVGARMVRDGELGRRISGVVERHGQADPATASAILADRLPAAARRLHSTLIRDLIARTGPDIVLDDLAQIAPAAIEGRIATLWYDSTQQVRGTLDERTGEVTLDVGGGDLLPRIALHVLRGSGTVLPVKPEDVAPAPITGRTLAVVPRPAHPVRADRPHERLPTVSELLQLRAPHPAAVTIYLPTDPRPHARARNATALRQASKQALTRLNAAGVDASERAAITARLEAFGPTSLWSGRSLALFLSPEFALAYALPDHLNLEVRAGSYFDLGQLMRVVSSPQEAFAVTGSGSGWRLWQASASAPVRPLADGSIADVRAALGRLDPEARRPLFVFGGPALDHPFQEGSLPWRVEVVPLNPEGLSRGKLGAELRSRAVVLARHHLSDRIALIRKEGTDGLPTTDLPEIARGAAAGAVRTFVYDATADVTGVLDPFTGEVRPDRNGYDVLAAIAIEVVRSGGEVLAVQPKEVRAEALDGPVLAELSRPAPEALR